MRYLFINVVAGSGSTGKIASEQCRQLIKEGHQCVLAYGRWKANCDDIETYKIGTSFDYRIHGLYTRLFDQHGFGSKRATRKFLQWVDTYNPEVIWIHNIHGYYINIEMLFEYLKKNDKKVYWTLHDCWSFTGHCAYFTYVRCDRWKTGCHGCPQKNSYPQSLCADSSRINYEKKRNIFCGVKDMTLITPSQWLADLAKESFLKEYPVEVVKNQINKEIFKPTPSDFRRKHGIDDKIILLGVASTWDARKGLKDYIELSKMLSDKYIIILVGLSKKQLKSLPSNILGLPKTESAIQLAEIYTAADVFVNCSYEENYPTVNLEAQACGTPVIAYDVGGTKETIRISELNNSLVSSGNVADVYRNIVKRTER